MEQLQAALTEADNAYIEKTGQRPYLGIGCDLTLRQSGQWKAEIWTKNHLGDHIRGHGDTPEVAVAALMDVIAALPSLDEARLREFQHDLGKLIDKGRDYGIDVDFVNPLIATAKRLAENALTDQRAQA
jgi:hypothetical protein